MIGWWQSFTSLIWGVVFVVGDKENDCGFFHFTRSVGAISTQNLLTNNTPWIKLCYTKPKVKKTCPFNFYSITIYWYCSTYHYIFAYANLYSPGKKKCYMYIEDNWSYSLRFRCHCMNWCICEFAFIFLSQTKIMPKVGLQRYLCIKSIRGSIWTERQ